jgi:hypothetical protein
VHVYRFATPDSCARLPICNPWFLCRFTDLETLILVHIYRFRKNQIMYATFLWKALNRPKEMNAVSPKVLLRCFPPVCPVARFIFTLSCLGMFWVHVMQIMNTIGGYKGVCNILLGMLCQVTSAKRAVLYEVTSARHALRKNGWGKWADWRKTSQPYFCTDCIHFLWPV